MLVVHPKHYQHRAYVGAYEIGLVKRYSPENSRWRWAILWAHTYNVIRFCVDEDHARSLAASFGVHPDAVQIELTDDTFIAKYKGVSEKNDSLPRALHSLYRSIREKYDGEEITREDCEKVRCVAERAIDDAVRFKFTNMNW